MSDDDDALELPSPKFDVKSFALDIEISAVPGKINVDKLMAAREMAIGEKILVNDDLRKINSHSDQKVIVKEIPVDLPKSAVDLAFSKFGRIVSIKMQLIGLWQKALVEFELSEVASLVVSKWSVFMGKNSVHVALAVSNKQTLLDSYGGRTCFIGCNPNSYVRDRCAVICFGDETSKLTAIGTIPVFKSVSLHWTSLSLPSCTCCKQFSHVMVNCPLGKNSGICEKRMVSDQDQICLAEIYKKKSALIAHPVSFSGKTWTQVVGGFSFRVVSFGLVGADLHSGLVFSSMTTNSPTVFHLSNQLAILECSLELLTDHISGILVHLESIGLVPVVTPSLSSLSAVSEALTSDVDSDMIVDTALVLSGTPPSVIHNAVVKLSSSSSKVLTAKVGVGSVLDKLNILCSGLGLSVPLGMNNCAKQTDIVRWHKDINNLVSIVTETKLRGMVHPWIANKFNSVCVFTSGLDSGHMGSGVAIIIDSSLAKHVCKILEVPGRLLSIRLLFGNKLSMSILGLYAGAFSVTPFVIFGGNFNEDGSHKCASFRKCFDLGLVNSLSGSAFTIDYMLVFSSLINAIVDRSVVGVEDFFDTDHKAVSVSVDLGGLLNFKNATTANASMLSDAFVAATKFSDKDAISVFNKVFSKFYRLKLLVSKLVKASCLDRLDSVGVSPVKFLFLLGSGFDAIHSKLAKARKVYHSSKMMESKYAEESCIRQAIERRIKSFEVDKRRTIKSVLECPFCKVVLDHLVVGEKLVLEPDLVKSKVDEIMESWTRKHAPLDYVFDDAFSEVMCSIGFDELLTVVSNLPDGKVLDMLLLLLNFCLVHESVPGPWKEAWVLMIPKPYEWKGIFMNTRPIALIETAHKILSKILLDRIFSACSRFDVLYGDNFSVLKGQELWLVLQDMQKVYDFVGWVHLRRSLVRIKMCDKFIRFFGNIYNGRTNRVMTDFSLTNGYHVYDGLDQGEENVCDYRLNSHFISRTGQVEPQAKLTSFFAASVFVNNTIWVGGSRAAMQHILNVAGKFFRINDILINNDKTVAIPINSRIVNPSLTINGSPISIAKKGEPYQYLGIFLFSEGLLMPSLAKAHLNIQFFVNLVLRKAISDKQFAYLVSAVFLPIINYRTQFSFVSIGVCNKWDSMVRRCLKSKSGLPLNFPNDAVYHSSLYNFKTFEQIQAKSKSAAVLAFANSVGILGCLFSHRSHDLQALTTSVDDVLKVWYLKVLMEFFV
ncbi:hypothetical protein G9A89_021187 [Geosiphon pyriformis]|nr:hypothetical protein G9A89_021187 [Geosiphon pyriformis]